MSWKSGWICLAAMLGSALSVGAAVHRVPVDGLCIELMVDSAGSPQYLFRPAGNGDALMPLFLSTDRDTVFRTIRDTDINRNRLIDICGMLKLSFEVSPRYIMDDGSECKALRIKGYGSNSGIAGIDPMREYMEWRTGVADHPYDSICIITGIEGYTPYIDDMPKQALPAIAGMEDIKGKDIHDFTGYVVKYLDEADLFYSIRLDKLSGRMPRVVPIDYSVDTRCINVGDADIFSSYLNEWSQGANNGKVRIAIPWRSDIKMLSKSVNTVNLDLCLDVLTRCFELAPYHITKSGRICKIVGIRGKYQELTYNPDNRSVFASFNYTTVDPTTLRILVGIEQADPYPELPEVELWAPFKRLGNNWFIF